MTQFDPIRDFYQPRQAALLHPLASDLQLVIEHSASQRGNFVFPGTDTVATVLVDGQRVGHVDYGLSPLLDRLYINMIEIDRAYRKQGIALGVLWQLWRTHQVPIIPLDQCTSSDGFWSRARRRFAAAGALLGEELRGAEQHDLEQQRWQHLVPEPEHKRKIRELMASPEWPAIKARLDAEYGPCQQN